ncbi:MAG TPA: hypothetical protein VLZ75_14745 [Chitinophagales bacterium]|nr:hypothetical protein [Chitinophagales bacterium]
MKVTNTTGNDHPSLPYWSEAGVSLTGRQDTYISIVSEPAKDQVKRVVFISAGQQSDSPVKGDWIFSGDYGEGYTNVLTGQPNNYKKGFRGTNNFEDTRSLNAKSLASKLIQSGEFPKESTLFVLAFDARFGFFRNPEEKTCRENAFFNLLTSKFNPVNIEVIVLAGQSRGGALAFRLGSRLRNHPVYSEIPLIIQGYDPVSTNPKLAGRYNTTFRSTPIEKHLPIHSKSDKLINPYDLNKYCWKIDMDVTFPPTLRNHLFVYILHAGGKVGLHKSIRAFAWFEENTNLGWYKQKWLNFEHEEMGGSFDSNHLNKTVESGFKHIITSLQSIKK